jgi:hypothetical protein
MTKVGEIKKNLFEKIIVSTQYYKGRKLIDIRVYIDDRNGDWIPTKKGISTTFDKVDALLKLIKKATAHQKK